MDRSRNRISHLLVARLERIATPAPEEKGANEQLGYLP
jgi:hypothetical protein